MASHDVLMGLFEATLATSLAIALVLAVRRPLRRLCGAGTAYASWALVPTVALAVSLPVASPGFAELPVVLVVPAVLAPLPAGDAGIAWQPWLVAGWLGGAVVLAAAMLLAQLRFRRSLGRLVPRGDELQSDAVGSALPATLGLLRPRVVLPADFDTRYSEAQRALVLAHERVHAERGDLHANAVVALLRALFWFNPLAHLAARRFRHDQELACDARVVARHPQARRAYGEALLQAQLAAAPSPLGCHFGFGHPLKERIAMLKEPVPSILRRRAGAAFVALLATGAGFAAWAASPPTGGETRNAEVGAVSMPAPEYPEAARAQRIGGMVSLVVDVAADGSVADAHVERSEPAGVFDAAALKAVESWKFTPLVKDGRAVPGRIRVPVRFEPPSEAKDDGAGGMSWIDMRAARNEVASLEGFECGPYRGTAEGGMACGVRN